LFEQEPYTSSENTWKFTVSGFARNVSLADQLVTINAFAYLGFKGNIALKKPQVEVGVFEEYVRRPDKQDKGRDLEEMRWVWMGRKVRLHSSSCRRAEGLTRMRSDLRHPEIHDRRL
jgi:hypothetical protein